MPKSRIKGLPKTVKIFQASPLFRETLLRLVEDETLSHQFKTPLEKLLLLELSQLDDETFALKIPDDPSGQIRPLSIVKNWL